MQFILAPSIHIPEGRQRRKFDEVKLLELQDSITSIGLLHAIVVRKVDGVYTLVAGERRMRAIKEAYSLGLPIKFGGTEFKEGFPCVSIDDLSESDAYEAELEENIQRDDLTWQERAAATARLMELRTRQAERTLDLPPPTPASLAAEIHGTAEGGFATSVRNEIILSRHLSNPEVAKAKSAKEAFKVLKHQEQRRKHAELAQKVGSTFTAKDHSLLQGSCLDLLSSLDDGQFDCLLTDPPYGMGADEFGDSGGRLSSSHNYDDSYDNWQTLMFDFVSELTRVMKPGAHAYVFCDIERFYELRSMFMEEDWKVFRTPIIWINPKGMRTPWPEHGPQRKYQTCLYGYRGDRPTLKIAPDVITYPSDVNEGHAAQKPIDLLKDLLSRSCHPGDSVLDPFCGSGSIFPAAHALKIKATGIEMDAAAYGLSAKRLGSLVG